MKTDLVDEEGYPIASVDIMAVRQARNIIICAMNDRNQLTSDIENALHELHAQVKDSLDESRYPLNLTNLNEVHIFE